LGSDSEAKMYVQDNHEAMLLGAAPMKGRMFRRLGAEEAELQ
jgi:hypothetical protein